nr:putative ribonuclease H-like domain-containing protein [Tanacetum cinerariifolium]
MVAAAKLPVLNPNEFELLKMRIEKYFLMTNYALWEVILNGDSPPPTRSVDGVETQYHSITLEEKLARKNKLKAKVNTAHGVFAANSKTNASNLPNVDSLSYNWSNQAEDGQTNFALMAYTSSSSLSSSNSDTEDQGIFDSGCSRHMTRNKSFLTDYQEIDGGFIAFGGSPKGGKITGKGKIRTGKLDFKDVYFVKKLKFNLFFVSQMCDKKNNVLSTKTECLVLSLDFKLLDKNKVLLKVPRQNNMYNFDLKNIDPSRDLTWKADEGFLVGYSINRRGPEWLFDIDSLTISMSYEPVTIGNQTNNDVGIEIHDNAGQARQEKASDHEYMLLPFMPSNSPLSSSTQSSDDKDVDEVPSKGDKGVSKGSRIDDQERTDSSSQDVNMAGLSINTANTNINTGSLNINTVGLNDPSMPSLEETSIFDDVYDDREGSAEADTNNLELSKVWTLMDLSNGKRVIRTKWVFRHKKDKRGIIVRNKVRLVAQGYTQEEGIDYDEVFAPVPRIEAIRLFFTYASFMGFIMYQMDVKSAFLYGTIEEEVYVCQPPGFEDQYFPNKVYKVEKTLYGLHQAPRAWYKTLSTNLLENRFRRGTIDKTLFIKKYRGDILLVQVYVDDIIFGSTKKSLCDEFEQMMHKIFQMSFMEELTFFLGLQVKQKDDGIFISQDKYMANILKKFNFTTVKITNTPIEPNKALIKDAETEDRIFRYLKGQPKLGLWYLIESPFDLEAFADSDYAGASLDRKSTTGSCQFLGKTLISWQCKKQTIVPNSTIKAEYVAAPNCCGQKIIVNEASIRCDLKLQDAEGSACLPNDTIFEELARIGKKVFANMKREGESYSKIITPLFETMMVQAPEEVGEGSETNQAAKIEKLMKIVKKIEGKKKKRTHGLKRMYKVGLSARIVSSDEEGLDQGRMNEENLSGVNDFDGDEVIVDVTTDENVEHDAIVAKNEVSTTDDEVVTTTEVTTAKDVKVTTAAATPQISKDVVTLGQTLIEIKAAKPRARA